VRGGFRGLTASVLSSEHLHFDLVTGGIDPCQSEREFISSSLLLFRDAGQRYGESSFFVPNVSISECFSGY